MKTYHINPKRIRSWNKNKIEKGPIVYWMSRDQRVMNNWALHFAHEASVQFKVPLLVIFCLVPHYPGAALRHYDFMIRGLKMVHLELSKKNIPFYILTGDPVTIIPRFIQENKAGALITDFDPIKIKRKWKKSILVKINTAMLEVDAHNIVPCWVASDKKEYAAYTFRPKIKRNLDEFLDEFPILRKTNKKKTNIIWDNFQNSIDTDNTVTPVNWLKPGEIEGLKMLKSFINNKLNRYHLDKNDPTKEALSNLSPYLHFGQLSAQRAALEVKKSNAPPEAKETFLEELIVRRELSDNFCYYEESYDSTAGFPNWAIETLKEHRKDPREYIYSLKAFEAGQTHDELWNACQIEMVKTGKMHGYMRMYWAKKILEWTSSPEQAMKIAIFLNDKYSLDGRDPNGYTGIAWSIGGVHDRAWAQRLVFGKIRFMSYNGCKSKFNIKDYINKVEAI